MPCPYIHQVLTMFDLFASCAYPDWDWAVFRRAAAKLTSVVPSPSPLHAVFLDRHDELASGHRRPVIPVPYAHRIVGNGRLPSFFALCYLHSNKCRKTRVTARRCTDAG